MTTILAQVPVETDRESIYNEFMARFEERKASILARIETGFVLQWESGLCATYLEWEGYKVGHYEHSHVFKNEGAAKLAAQTLRNGKNAAPAVVPASKARFRALGKVLYAMAEMSSAMGK